MNPKSLSGLELFFSLWSKWAPGHESRALSPAEKWHSPDAVFRLDEEAWAEPQCNLHDTHAHISWEAC